MFLLSYFLFLFLANTGIPLILNWLEEQLSLIGIWERSPIVAALGATGIVFSAIYSIYLYNRISYGVFSPFLGHMVDINRQDFNFVRSNFSSYPNIHVWYLT